MNSVAVESAGAARAAGKGKLLRVLGVVFGLAVTIGITIGMGILRTPGEIAGRLPSAPLFLGVWLAGGLYALLGANSLSELSAMIPRSGGYYVFARRGCGEYVGFVIGWSDWLSTCGTTAILAMVFAEYVGIFLPRLAGRGVPVALAVIVGFALLQWRGVRWGSRTQVVTSLLKAITFAVLIAACFLFDVKDTTGEGARLVAPTGWPLVTAFVLSLQAVLYTYDGWASTVYFGEEVREPGRDIPRAMLGGVASVIAIYVLVNAALLRVLPWSRLAGEKLAVGAAAEVLFGAAGAFVLGTIA
ncbi:MAG TPA: APC family permease, partial [Pyrinomonadaceae bacterium]|nr:APC family permease [Pyrinomonadaceae bacterium]